jgi:hypothetical protein
MPMSCCRRSATPSTWRFACDRRRGGGVFDAAATPLRSNLSLWLRSVSVHRSRHSQPRTLRRRRRPPRRSAPARLRGRPMAACSWRSVSAHAGDGVERLGTGIEGFAHPLRQVSVIEPERRDRAVNVDEILQATLVVGLRTSNGSEGERRGWSRCIGVTARRRSFGRRVVRYSIILRSPAIPGSRSPCRPCRRSASPARPSSPASPRPSPRW